MPGVEVLANEIDTIITGNYVIRLVKNRPIVLAFIFIACLIGFAIGYIRHPLILIALIIGAMSAYIVIWGVAFLAFRVQLPVVAPEVGLASGCLFSILKQKRLVLRTA